MNLEDEIKKAEQELSESGMYDGFVDASSFEDNPIRSKESLDRARKFNWTDEEYKEFMEDIYNKVKEAYSKNAKEALDNKIPIENLTKSLFEGPAWDDAMKSFEEAQDKYPWLFPNKYGYKLDIPDEFLPTDEWMDEIEAKRAEKKSKQKDEELIKVLTQHGGAPGGDPNYKGPFGRSKTDAPQVE